MNNTNGALQTVASLFNFKRDGEAQRSDVGVSLEKLVIETQEDLADLRVVKKRQDIVGNATLAAKVSVVEVEGGGFAILTHPEYRKAHVVDEVARRVQKLSRGSEVKIYTIAPLMLLSLNKTSDENLLGSRKKHTTYEVAFESVIEFAIANKASDITFNVYKDKEDSQIFFQIDGMYVAPRLWRLPTARMEEILSIVWQAVKGGSESFFSGNEEQQGKVETFAYGKKVMLRWSSIATDRGPSVTFRALIQEEVKDIEFYGYLPSHLAMFVRNQASGGGIIGIAGRVGMGKTSSTASLLNRLPRFWKIISIEDPVEIELPHVIQCTVENRLDGSKNASYVSKLFSLKRNAPNAVSLGEIRDKLTGEGVIEVGGMGTQLYLTVHALGMVQIPERLASKSIQIPRDFLASPGMLKLLVYQILVPKLCECALDITEFEDFGGNDATGVFREASYWTAYLERLDRIFQVDSRTLKVRNTDGCECCRNEHFTELNGFRGRDQIAEMMEPNAHYKILECIASGDTLGLQSYLNTLPRSRIDDENMDNKTIIECGMYKALKGSIDPRDIELATESFETVERLPRYANLKSEVIKHERA